MGKVKPLKVTSLNSDIPPVNPLKADEFEAFLSTLSEDVSVRGSWKQIAQAVGVNPDTIQAWRQHPKAQALIKAAIDKSLEGMKKAGMDDWRMHQASAKMYGVDFGDQKMELTGKDGGPVQVQPILGGKSVKPKK